MSPFLPSVERIDSIRGGRESAGALKSDDVPQPRSAKQVAHTILEPARGGAERAGLVPERLMGTDR